MRLKVMVTEMLRCGDRQGLERLVAGEPRAVRHLQGRLWDPDPAIGARAGEALGAAAAHHPELGEEILRRALWALNDESATNGAAVLPAIGEIGHRCPQLVAPFVAPMVSYLWDEGLRPGILRALCRIAESAPELVAGVRDRLPELGDTEEPGERACLERLLTVIREGVDGA